MTTVGFDIAALELYLPLLGGGTVADCAVRDGEGRRGAAWRDREERRDCDAGDADAVAGVARQADEQANEPVNQPAAGARTEMPAPLRLRACGCWLAARR